MNTKKILSSAGLIAGFFFGAVALSALAQTAGWSPAPATPPNGNVPAPINVGTTVVSQQTTQTRNGPLAINGVFGVGGTFMYMPSSGQAPAYGDVLMAVDSNGTAEWVATSSLGIGGNTANNTTINNDFTHNYYVKTAGTYSWTVPPGITSIEAGVWAGGSGGGGHGDSTHPHGLGGPAGSTDSKTYTVTPGEVLTITVGAGGQAAGDYLSGCINYEGGAGGDSYIRDVASGAYIVHAYGGAGGYCTSGSATAGGSTGALYGFGGGSGGPVGNGGPYVQAGTAPGGGGGGSSGGSDGGGTVTAGNGASGGVIIVY
ncbi:MAG: hypothetical protein KGI49_02080 [Patescibacteria group bacterium]|nr:hypothetical protein [Patescibacteria group bacterium]